MPVVGIGRPATGGLYPIFGGRFNPRGERISLPFTAAENGWRKPQPPVDPKGGAAAPRKYRISGLLKSRVFLLPVGVCGVGIAPSPERPLHPQALPFVAWDYGSDPSDLRIEATLTGLTR